MLSIWSRIRYSDKQVRNFFLEHTHYALKEINFSPMEIREDNIFLVMGPGFIDDFNEMREDFKRDIMTKLFESTLVERSSYYTRIEDLETTHYCRPFAVQTKSTKDHIVYELIGFKSIGITFLRKFVKNNFTKYRLAMKESELCLPGKVPVLRIEKSDMTFMTLLDKRIEKHTLLDTEDNW